MSQEDVLENYRDFAEKQEAKKIFENPLLKQDIWSTKDLGLKIEEHRRCLTLNFSDFLHDEFKVLVKLYILVRALRKISLATIRSEIGELKEFSIFLKSSSIYNVREINEQVFDSFDGYLRSRELNRK